MHTRSLLYGTAPSSPLTCRPTLLRAVFTLIDLVTVLAKVVALPISQWSFKTDTATPHVGPMAQDFRDAFGLGADDKHIATVDDDSAALAAIHRLNQKLEQKEREITELKQINQSLERRLTVIEQTILNQQAN